MIYTLTLSPAIDYNMTLPHLSVHKINKSKMETFHSGGKGINVSVILKELGEESTCLGFLGGFTGKFIKNELDQMNVKNDFIWTNLDTRINVKIKDDNGETAIDGTGPLIKNEYVDKLKEQIKTLHKGDYLVLSGNTCYGVNDNIYEELLTILDKEVVVVVDSVRHLLFSSLRFKPLFIKPNKEELEEALSIKIHNQEELIEACKTLQEKGARNVVVSLGEKGAFLLDEDGNKAVVKIKKSDKEMVNTIGCGDACVAGMVYSLVHHQTIEEAVKYAVACGTACAYTERFAKKEEIEVTTKLIISHLYRK